MLRTARIWILALQFTSFGLLAGGLSPFESRPEQAEASKPHIGLAEGEVAPPFSAHDQFGQEQDNHRIAGKNGTVLLFFRSADW